eukprot:1683755-Pleurochrysis_carterae.AAC.1
MLGGNSGYFTKDRDCMAVTVHNPRFGEGWIAVRCSALCDAFDLEPATQFLQKAMDNNYEVRDSCVRRNSASIAWSIGKRSTMVTLAEDEYQGGGMAISDECIKTQANIIAIMKRKRIKHYQTEVGERSEKKRGEEKRR